MFMAALWSALAFCVFGIAHSAVSVFGFNQVEPKFGASITFRAGVAMSFAIGTAHALGFWGACVLVRAVEVSVFGAVMTGIIANLTVPRLANFLEDRFFGWLDFEVSSRVPFSMFAAFALWLGQCSVASLLVSGTILFCVVWIT